LRCIGFSFAQTHTLLQTLSHTHSLLTPSAHTERGRKGKRRREKEREGEREREREREGEGDGERGGEREGERKGEREREKGRERGRERREGVFGIFITSSEVNPIFLLSQIMLIDVFPILHSSELGFKHKFKLEILF